MESMYPVCNADNWSPTLCFSLLSAGYLHLSTATMKLSPPTDYTYYVLCLPYDSAQLQMGLPGLQETDILGPQL